MHIIEPIYSGYVSLLLNRKSENPIARFRLCCKIIVIQKIEVARFIAMSAQKGQKAIFLLKFDWKSSLIAYK